MSSGLRVVNQSDNERRRTVSTTGTQMDVRTLKVDGATLYHEVRGSGPLLLLITGGPTDAGMFTDLTGRLADRYTVVSTTSEATRAVPSTGSRRTFRRRFTPTTPLRSSGRR